jgi:hypothetical protein
VIAPTVSYGEIDEKQRDDESAPVAGARTLLIDSYEIPRHFYSWQRGGAAYRMRDLGAMFYYASVVCKRMGHKKRIPMDVDKLVEAWSVAVVGLAVAHDKDEADRHEASIDSILTPLLAAPIKQVREFAPKLMERLKNDPQVPFLVWRPFEIWMDMVNKAPDEGVKELKTQLARDIADIVEEDLKPQLGEALVRALQWRSPEKLEEVRKVVEREKEKGNAPRLRGRESCLFMECGGTDEEPEVCVQI